MKIRKCREKDIAVVTAFYDRVVEYLECHVNYPRWVYKEYPSESFVRQMTDENSLYICFENDEIVGAFVLNEDPQGNYRKGKWSRDIPDGEYLVIHALAIATDKHGRGLGSEIVNFCIEEARKNGYKALRLDAVPDNIPALKLYKKSGFAYVGDEDLDRGIDYIPSFSLLEMNF
ncbi:Ribosomal protein S18 acetylase RimI [Butyrivibrio sp. INlla16]|nr:Ribosomal protein S18 acetylase RimI [Butyrivibrio sp. INlla16]